jgi:hypothetical protein
MRDPLPRTGCYQKCNKSLYSRTDNIVVVFWACVWCFARECHSSCGARPAMYGGGNEKRLVPVRVLDQPKAPEIRCEPLGSRCGAWEGDSHPASASGPRREPQARARVAVGMLPLSTDNTNLPRLLRDESG